MKILFIDDDPKLHIVIDLWLSRNGHHVENAYNGKEALEKLEKEYFDGLITDINMPLFNGVELVKAALQLPAPPKLIVVLTSRCDIPQLVHEINSAKVHLFGKPFSPAALAELIEQLVAQKANI